MSTVSIRIAVAVVACVMASAAEAQLAQPNELGVRMGHVHITVSDLEASKKFWIQEGGIPMKAGTVDLIKFQGTFLILRAAKPTGDSAASIVNHIGFLTRNGAENIARWRTLTGAKVEVNAAGTGGFFTTPDGLRVEIPERSTIDVPIVFDQIHFFPQEPSTDGGSSIKKMIDWYTSVFGAKPGKPGGLPNNYYEEVKIPGVNLRFSGSAKPVSPTTGRAIDHIGFEISNLEEFCTKLEARGIKLDRPYTRRPDLGVSTAFVTDPWGTSIELTEGLDKK